MTHTERSARVNDPMVYNEVHLEQMKLVLASYITAELAEQFAIEPTVEINSMLKWHGDEIVLRVVQKIYGREMERIEVRYPADWWQALKERWFPPWAKRWWPVQETVIDLVARELYPRVALPDHGPTIALDYHERGKW
jgi:hypothetical protein